MFALKSCATKIEFYTGPLVHRSLPVKYRLTIHKIIKASTNYTHEEIDAKLDRART
jgi:hypothetical protein